MASVQEIRDLVVGYLVGEMSASDFANRFTPVLKAAISSRDAAAKQVGLEVHAQIAHYFNGFISEDEFRANLMPIGASVGAGIATVSYQIVRSIELEQAPVNPTPVPASFPDPVFTS